MTLRYPYARPGVSEADIQAVANSLTGQFLTQGPQLEAFERELCNIFGARHAVVCNSGTAALHLVYMALDLGPERGLLTSPVTFLATANAARMCGASVIFADVDPATGNVTPDTLTAALDSAEQPVDVATVIHLGGRPCDMAGIREVTKTHGAALVEDACHAPLAEYRTAEGKVCRVGACDHSDVAVFSFHAIKHIAMGEGGAVLTNDKAIAESARTLRNHGMVRAADRWRSAPESGAPWYYEMHELGWNYRACEMQCALGFSQLARLEEGMVRRREIAAIYDKALSGLNHVSLPSPDEGHAWHLYPIAIDFDAVGKTRGEVMRSLAAQGIGTQVHYIPLYRQPFYAGSDPAGFPGAEYYYARSLSIPMYPGLSDDDVAEISAAVRQVVSG